VKSLYGVSLYMYYVCTFSCQSRRIFDLAIGRAVE